MNIIFNSFTDKKVQILKSVIDILYLAKQNEVEISLSGDQLLLKVEKNRTIDTNLLNEIKAKKDLIVDFVKNNKKDISFYKIKKRDKSSSLHISLSFSQERLWFIAPLPPLPVSTLTIRRMLCDETLLQVHVPLPLS